MFAVPIEKKGKLRTDIFYWEVAVKLAKNVSSWQSLQVPRSPHCGFPDPCGSTV